MIIKNNPKNFGKIYNVEFYLGNGQISTFSNILINVGDGYFYFEDEDGRLDIIDQKAIRTLTCCENKKGWK